MVGEPIPFPDCWSSTEDYVENLLDFATSSDLFQILCGGVHILDFFTSDPGLFHTVIPEEWRAYLLEEDPMRFLDLLMRDDLDKAIGEPDSSNTSNAPPESLVTYIRQIRKFSLARDFSARQDKLPKLTRPVSVGMKPKKVHEVCNFAHYVDRLAGEISADLGGEITHFVDFGSGQNYLGRALASAPYNRQIVAVEGREHNIAGAKTLDLFAGVVEKPKVMRNKKLWMQKLDSLVPEGELDAKAQRRAEKLKDLKISDDYVADFRPLREIGASYEPEEGKGHIRYIEGRLESGDLTDVITQLENDEAGGEADADAVAKAESEQQKQLRLMAISIHSCGNLSHHGIRSLIMNPRVEAIAIVGCCYNLVTEKLGPPTYKHPYMRPSLQALNGRVVRESAKKDPQGFPMSQKLCDYKDVGIRLNITARMMACQAPQNWTDAESDSFFTRHFYRAVLQKLFLDRGVINKVYYTDHGESATSTSTTEAETPFNTSTNPVIIGSLRKACYKSFNAYVRGAVDKLTTNDEYHEYCDVVREKMGDITDEEIARYEAEYMPRKRELSAIWSLMAFSAVVVESLIVTDRYLFLKQHGELVQDCWVEPVFDYQQSPRNLVVVGVKRSRLQIETGEENQTGLGPGYDAWPDFVGMS
ncbi:methyltransferase domain-containing protein [Microdochium trichocladiopsis]|uniref:Methyltransferase domain-containing protein n=1 Tax=Microdochium trichocladiopsis TaxID=1682393 RepID=A0A9P8Y936_9PEZI|nr:methyltransferase domain-containing protein [Microdochium trichocladiopsis]KAH7032961.1 methyltransferase domain-containing protein [Microdochium trichocladiopsis]